MSEVARVELAPATEARHARRGPDTAGLATIEKNRLGMLLFLTSEAVFFTFLIIAFVYFRSAWIDDEATASLLDVGLTGLFTAVLLASSLTIWLAERSLQKGSQGGMRAWLLLTIVLGAIFLIGQGTEYAKLFGEEVKISSGLFGTTFFTLTGFHGLHVFMGLVALTILAGLALAGAFPGPHSVALEVISLYWHFVDLVWIAVFSTVYLWTYFR